MPIGLFIKAPPLKEFAAQLFNFATEAFPDEEPVSLTLHTSVGINAAVGQVPASTLARQTQIQNVLSAFEGVRQVQCTHINIKQSGNNPAIDLAYNSADGIVGTFTISSPRNDVPRVGRVLAVLAKHFTLTPHAALISEQVSASERSALQMRERSAAELAEAAARADKTLQDLIDREVEATKNLRLEHERLVAERVARLEEEAQRQRSAFEERANAREAELAERETAFNKRKEEFETREARFVRRKLLDQINGVLEGVKSFSISTGTVKKRDAVENACLALMGCAVLGIAGILLYRFWGSHADWRLAFPVTACTTILLSTFVYYTKWSDRWFREHADAEFAAQRYQADILRASWIAELAAEWSEAHEGQPLQAELVAAFTRGLFADVGASGETEHPMEHLMSLMKRATEISVGKGGAFSLRAPAQAALASPPAQAASGD